MIKEKDYIFTNQKNVGHVGKIMTAYTANKLLDIDRIKHSHLLVVMDTFDYETYTVAVERGKLLEAKERYSTNMQRILEVVELEPTNQTIASYLKGNKINAFKDFGGRDIG